MLRKPPKGIVSDKFYLRLPTYDVDEGVFSVVDGDDIDDTLYDEVDTITFDGEKNTNGDGSCKTS